MVLELTHTNIFYSKTHHPTSPIQHGNTCTTINQTLIIPLPLAPLYNPYPNNQMQTQQQSPTRRYIKIVLVGQSGVGKSNIISRYIQNKFCIGANPTIGLEFSEKHVKINTDDIILQIWDTAGQERFRALNKTFYNNSLGALVVFDLTERGSFEMLGRWIGELRQHLAESAVLLLLGNKCDIKEQKVTISQASQFARKEGMGFLQTSAAVGSNVREAFQLLTRKIVEQAMEVKEFKMNTVKMKPAKIEPRRVKTASQIKRDRCCK